MSGSKDKATIAKRAVIAEFRTMVQTIGVNSAVPAKKLAIARSNALHAFSVALGEKGDPELPAGTPGNLMWTSNRHKGESIVDYIVRVYGGAGWLDKGMTLNQLRERDSSAVHRLYAWIRENDKKWPDALKDKLPGDRPGKIPGRTIPKPKR